MYTHRFSYINFQEVFQWCKFLHWHIIEELFWLGYSNSFREHIINLQYKKICDCLNLNLNSILCLGGQEVSRYVCNLKNKIWSIASKSKCIINAKLKISRNFAVDNCRIKLFIDWIHYIDSHIGLEFNWVRRNIYSWSRFLRLKNDQSLIEFITIYLFKVTKKLLHKDCAYWKSKIKLIAHLKCLQYGIARLLANIDCHNIWIIKVYYIWNSCQFVILINNIVLVFPATCLKNDHIAVFDYWICCESFVHIDTSWCELTELWILTHYLIERKLNWLRKLSC